eukprot:c3844_g1_i1.p1 GENE.c3844_g1_i1~~c3844_g1_i1.p1  ORF type:complete len:201 (-),score=14.79 c3844_g1_i1:124-669(-)
MGALWSRVLSLVARHKKCRILMVGLDGAGKTTTLFRLKLGELVSTVPTVGFNVEMIKFRNIEFTIWDVGGQEKLRPLWPYYGEDAQGVIFLLDSNDLERIDIACFELKSLFAAHDLSNAVLLVLANKQDLPNAMKLPFITDKLDLGSLRVRKFFIQGCSATSGTGLMDGIEWMSQNISTAR